mmetsp:Transcript_662/g.1642  ORF Transcript_662/g.1642 Transcript_662/m.1642 type:complete len:155 (-) Transcript_662:2254-2718(-)
MGSSSFFLVSGFSLLILAGVLVSDRKFRAPQPPTRTWPNHIAPHRTLHAVLSLLRVLPLLSVQVVPQTDAARPLLFSSSLPDRTSTEQPFGLGSLPVHITALLLASFALTLAGSVGIGAALTPIKAQAGDRVHEVLTHRPGFVNFNHRILPDAS